MSKAVRDQVLGHADESDGIEEYDNPLPDWWLGMFWFTIVFALAYTIHYHVIAKRSYPQALAAELAEARARWPEQQQGGPVKLVLTPENIEKGRAVFTANCIACHGRNLEGGIGPSLKDDAWIHGDRAEDVVKTITEGVAAKGMPTWGPILGPEKVRQVAAFLASQNPSIKQ